MIKAENGEKETNKSSEPKGKKTRSLDSFITLHSQQSTPNLHYDSETSLNHTECDTDIF